MAEAPPQLASLFFETELGGGVAEAATANTGESLFMRRMQFAAKL